MRCFARRPNLWLATGLISIWGQLSWAQTVIVSGRVRDGDIGVAGATISATNLDIASSVISVQTDTNGYYTNLLTVANYSISASKTNLTFSPSPFIGALTFVHQVDFVVVYSITGRVTATNLGLSGVNVELKAVEQDVVLLATQTDSDGSFAFPGLTARTYTVQPSKTNHLFEPAFRTIEVGPMIGTNRSGINFSSSPPLSISGRVSSGANALQGVTISVSNTTTQAGFTNLTDSSGRFAFSSLMPATYRVTPTLEGFSFAPNFRLVSTNATNVDFTTIAASLRGQVTDDALGVEGVTVTAGTNVVVTDPDGYFQFQNLSGPYVVVPSQAGYTFNPARRALSISPGIADIIFQRGPTQIETAITTCDAPSLSSAVAAGGRIAFECDGVLPVAAVNVVAADTFLDATERSVTLDGDALTVLFEVKPLVRFHLSGLRLISGRRVGMSGTGGDSGADAFGGAIYNDGGYLSALSCFFTSNAVTGGTGAVGVARLSGRGDNGGHGGNAGGGAIYSNGGSVTLTNCEFMGNSASGGPGGNGADASTTSPSNHGGNGGNGGVGTGGAIRGENGASLVFVNCTFASNLAIGAVGGASGTGTGVLGFPGSNGSAGAGAGGGIYCKSGSMLLTYSTLTSNSVTSANGGAGKGGGSTLAGGLPGTPGGDAFGGAILCLQATLAMTNCTLFANSVNAGDGGKGGDGGIAGFGGIGAAGGGGGAGLGAGLYFDGGSSAKIVNCTFADGQVGAGEGGSGGNGGSSIAKSGPSGSPGVASGGAMAVVGTTMLVGNTIFAGSIGGDNTSGAISDGGGNLSSDHTPALADSSNQNGIDPLLGSLADNQGPTKTMALLPGSPAIDRGNDALAPPLDQRYRDRSGLSDIGAFEYSMQSIPSLQIRKEAEFAILSWSSEAEGFSLQFAPTVAQDEWTAVSELPAKIGSNLFVTNQVDGPSRFYRLTR